MNAVDPATLDRLTNEALANLEVCADRMGWDEIVVMCRDERQRRDID